MKKSKKIKANNILKYSLIAVLAGGATWGALRLAGIARGHNDKTMKQLLKINLDKDFFKDAEVGTETISTVSYQTYTLDVKKDKNITWQVKLVVYAGESKDFAETLALDASATGAYVQVTNMNIALCEVAGQNADKEDVIDTYLGAYTEETKTDDAYSKVAIKAGNVSVMDSIAFYGIAKDQPKK